MHLPTLLLLSLTTTTALAAPPPKPPPPSPPVQWQTLPQIPNPPRQEHTTVFLPPHNIVILGGITAGTNSTTALVHTFSLLTHEWAAMPPLPIPLNHPNAAVVDGKIYVVGGLAQTETAWTASSEAWVYEPLAGAWRDVAGMPTGKARGSAAVGVFEGKIVLAGGLREIQLVRPWAQETVATVSIYDTRKDRWLEVPEAAGAMPDMRDHACGAVERERFVVAGGREKGGLVGKGSVLSLDLRAMGEGWRVMGAAMLTPRAGMACAVVGGRLVAMGGEGNLEVESGVFNETEAYDIRKDRWESLRQMKMPRHGGGAVAVGRRVYVPGGGDMIGMAPVTYFDTLDL